MALGSTQLLTEISTRSISWGLRRSVRKADNLPQSCAVVTKCGNLKFLEYSGSLRACNGTGLPRIVDVAWNAKIKQTTPLSCLLYLRNTVSLKETTGNTNINCQLDGKTKKDEVTIEFDRPQFSYVDKLTDSQLDKVTVAFCGTRQIIIMFLHCSSHQSPKLLLPFNFCFIAIFPSKPGSCKLFYFLQVFQKMTQYAFLLSPIRVFHNRQLL